MTTSVSQSEATPRPTPPVEAAPSDVGQFLLDEGVIEAAQLTQARNVHQQTPGARLADVLIEQGVDEAAVQRAVAAVAGLPFERIDLEELDHALIEKVGVGFCKDNGVMPIRRMGSRVVVGLTHPQRLFLLDEVRRKLQKPVKVVLVPAIDVLAAAESLEEEQRGDVQVDEIIKDIAEDDVEIVEADEDEVDLESQAAKSPVIRFVNYLIHDAARQGASDIHIEPQEKRLRIRYRIDGVLFEAMNPPHAMHAAIVSRLKIMGNLDISERRLPQDGRIRVSLQGRQLDLRLSTLPTGQGEKAVMRILDQKSIRVTLDQLGFPQHTLNAWRQQIDQPHGIVMVTGPTGSGKSTTLYASLGQMDKNKLNISTVEDPIEYHLDGISQVQVHESIGMTFAAALRSMLRQDPDVILVGEIRDMDTARIAVQAALTGHLVLSTLHTNDAPSSVTRLINIGVEPFLIGAAVNGVLAQRLVRRVCSHCKSELEPNDNEKQLFDAHGIACDKVMRGSGCPKCHETGYAGRVGLYEMLTLDDTLRDAIASNPDVTAFRRLCIQQGMKPLRTDGLEKAGQGVTTVEEVIRVTHTD